MGERIGDGQKKSTMRDVSRATGLSMFTVSRALSGAAGVSDDSRANVISAARSLGYIPNRAAQELRRSSRDTVALITAGTTNSYYLDLMGGIQGALRPSSWTVVVADVAVDGVYDAALEERIVQRLIQSRTAGVISTLTLTAESTALFSSWDVPVVFVDSSPPESARDFPSVTTDNYNASLAVGEHLAGHGFKDWLFLVYPAKWSTRYDRERGLVDCAAANGARIVVAESENDALSAYRKLADELDRAGRLPDVLIAGNNPLLLGALKLARDRGLRIPDDMALVAYDEFPWASLIDPPVTVLNESSDTIGRLAAETLAAIIADGPGSGLRVYDRKFQQQVPAELIVRRSCGCPTAARTKAPQRDA